MHTVRHIFIAPSRGAAVVELESVRAIRYGGLVGDRWCRSPWTFPLRILNAWQKVARNASRSASKGGLKWYRSPRQFTDRFRAAWPAGKVFDWTNITVITTAEIEDGNIKLPEPMTPAEMRRNIVLDSDVDMNGFLGCLFRIGEVIIFGDNPCTPCHFPTQRAQKSLVTAKQFNTAFGHPNPTYGGNPNRGGLRGKIVRGGIIRVGDSLTRFDGSPIGPETTRIRRPSSLAVS